MLKEKQNLEFWKLGAVYFCTVKTFFSSFQKLGAGSGGQPNNLFLALLNRPTSLIVTLTVASSLLCFCMVVARKKSTTSVLNFVNVLKLNPKS